VSIDLPQGASQRGPVRVRVARSFADVCACVRIRLTVFVVEQRVPLAEELDAYDGDAVHLLADHADETVGVARLVRMGDGVAKVGRVAVLRRRRGAGVGSALMSHIIEAERSRSRTLILDAQLSAMSFYERLGFVAEGEVFMDAGIPHRRMELRLR